MTDMLTIYAGDTGDVWETGVDTAAAGSPESLAELDVNYTCQLLVRKTGTSATPIDRMINDKNLAGTLFLSWLTPAETAALGAGTFEVAHVIRNPTLSPPLVRELRDTVRIEKSIKPAT